MTAPAPTTSASGFAARLGVWCAVWVVTTGLLLLRMVIVRDEAWMLWIATRVARGEVLYRDVYDVTTPAAAWLAAVAIRVTGTQMATLRALQAAVFATQVLLGLSVMRRCRVRPVGRVTFVLVLFALAAPVGAWVSLYSALAICFGMATLRATLWWLDADGRPAAAWTVGVTGALAFWTKPNVGGLLALAAAAAALAALWGTPIRGWWPPLARMAGGAVVVSMLCSLVIVATGAWPAFVDQVFRSKGQYVDVGFGYLPALRDRYHLLVTGAVPFQVRRLTNLLVQATPILFVGAVTLGAIRSRRAPRGPLVAMVAFAAAGMLAVLPRPGLNHITGVMPLVVTAVVGTWVVGDREREVASVRGAAAVAFAGFVALVAVVAAVVPLVRPPNADRLRRDVTHFRWTPVTDRQLQPSGRLSRQLRARGVEAVFIARKDAGFLYLRTGTRNPLPFDIVERSDLGGDDEAGVIRRLAAGEAEWVCLRKPGSGGRSDLSLVPARLERWIRAHLELEADLARCELYRGLEVRGRTSVRARDRSGASAARG